MFANPKFMIYFFKFSVLKVALHASEIQERKQKLNTKGYNF